MIVRIVEKKKEERDKEDLIELRIVEIAPRQFHKYLKVFKKKELKRIPMRKIWDYAIDLREGFVLEREISEVCKGSVEKGVY